METQLELFPVQKTIPDWVAQCFYKANAGDYGYKQSFYTHIKPYILRTFAHHDGYDLQIIERKCWSCEGTGIYKHYHYENGERYVIKREPCYSCTGGIYLKKEISLERWIMNGVLYHIPSLQTIRFESYKYKNEIKGIVKHDTVDPKEAYKAYLALLWKYNKTMFYDHVRRNIDIKIKWLSEFIQSLFRKDNSCDDLPF